MGLAARSTVWAIRWRMELQTWRVHRRNDRNSRPVDRVALFHLVQVVSGWAGFWIGLGLYWGLRDLGVFIERAAMKRAAKQEGGECSWRTQS